MTHRTTTRTTQRLRRACAVTGAAAALALTLSACGGGDSLEESDGSDPGSSGQGGSKKELVIGSAGFTEAQVMAELYAKALSDAGYSTTIKKLANRELYEPALEKGDIDVFPEYAATMAEFLNAKENGAEEAEKNPVASADADDTVAALRELAEPRGLTVLDAGKAVDQNAFAVTKDFAQKNDLKTLSDVGEAGLKIKLAAGDECPDRPFCEPGLEKTYGIDITSIDPKGVGTVQSKEAVKDGTDQMLLTTTTDATLDQFGLVLLEDDKKLQNADNLVPVLNTEEAGTDTKVTDVLDKLTATLTTQDLTDLNGQVDGERKKPADVAAAYLADKGITG